MLPAWGRTHMRRCRLTELERARAASARLSSSQPPPPPLAKPALCSPPLLARPSRLGCPPQPRTRRIRAARGAGWHADVADAARRFAILEPARRTPAWGCAAENSTRGRLKGGPPARSGVCARVGVGARALTGTPLTDCGSQRAKIGRDRTHLPRVAPTARPRGRAREGLA